MAKQHVVETDKHPAFNVEQSFAIGEKTAVAVRLMSGCVVFLCDDDQIALETTVEYYLQEHGAPIELEYESWPIVDWNPECVLRVNSTTLRGPFSCLQSLSL